MRREVADRVVAPVVGQAALGEEGFGHVLVHREQLDRGHPEIEQVGDRRLVAEPGVGAAQLGRDVRVGRGEPLDVDLVDDRVRVPAERQGLGGPVVGRVHHQAARHVRGRVEGAGLVVGVIGRVTEHLRPEPDLAGGRQGVRVEQQLGRVAARPAGRIVGAGRPVSVRLSGTDPGHERVPDAAVAIRHRDPRLRTVARRTGTAASRRPSRTRRRSSCRRPGQWRPAGTRCLAALPTEHPRRSRLWPSGRTARSTSPMEGTAPCRRLIRSATSPVQPVWCAAPRPAPLSPWKYSLKIRLFFQAGSFCIRSTPPKHGRRPSGPTRKIETSRSRRSAMIAL